MDLPDTIPVKFITHSNLLSVEFDLNNSAIKHYSEKIRDISTREIYLKVLAQMSDISEQLSNDADLTQRLESLGLIYRLQAYRLFIRPLCTTTTRSNILTKAATNYFDIGGVPAYNASGPTYYNTGLYFTDTENETVDGLVYSSIANLWRALDQDVYLSTHERLQSWLQLNSPLYAQVINDDFLKDTVEQLKERKSYFETLFISLNFCDLEYKELLFFRFLLQETHPKVTKELANIWKINVGQLIPNELTSFGVPGLLTLLLMESFLVVSDSIQQLPSELINQRLISIDKSNYYIIDLSKKMEQVVMLSSYLSLFNTYTETTAIRDAMVFDLKYISEQIIDTSVDNLFSYLIGDNHG